jgi:hypothetical protein
MSKAKVGSGHLTPFKKGSTDSESVGGSTNKEYEKEGCTHHVYMEKATRWEDELEPFKTGPESPGVNRGNPTVPAFRKRGSTVKNPHGYQAFKE